MSNPKAPLVISRYYSRIASQLFLFILITLAIGVVFFVANSESVSGEIEPGEHSGQTEVRSSSEELGFSQAQDTTDTAPEFIGSRIANQNQWVGFKASGILNQRGIYRNMWMGFRCASSGNGPLTYSLAPPLPTGLRIHYDCDGIGIIRVLGVREQPYEGQHILTVTDQDGDNDTMLLVFQNIDDTYHPAAFGFKSFYIPNDIFVGRYTKFYLPALKDSDLSHLDSSCVSSAVYTLSPTLPAGLTFSNTQGLLGVIGAPTVAVTNKTYTLNAQTNCGVSLSTNFQLTIKEQGPYISKRMLIEPSIFGSGCQNPSSNIVRHFRTIWNSNGQFNQCYYAPAEESHNYSSVDWETSRISEENSNSILGEQLHTLAGSYFSNVLVLYKNIPSSKTYSIDASSSDGSLLTYHIEPNLPMGLSFQNGRLLGTATVTSPFTLHTITVQDGDGDIDTYHLGLQVDEFQGYYFTEPISVDNSDVLVDSTAFRPGVQIDITLPQTTGSQRNAGYELEGNLPQGLVRSNNKISGIINSSWAEQALDSENVELLDGVGVFSLRYLSPEHVHGRASISFEMVVEPDYDIGFSPITNEQASWLDGSSSEEFRRHTRNNIDDRYLVNNSFFVQGKQTMRKLPNITGNRPLTLTIEPELPTGLALETWDYSNDIHTFRFTAPLDNLEYRQHESIWYNINEVSPFLYSKVYAISGTPLTTLESTEYTITVTDSDGDTGTYSFSLSVETDEVPSIDAVEDQTLQVGVPASIFFPSTTGGNGNHILNLKTVDSRGIETILTNLPPGLIFGYAEGRPGIFGTPTEPLVYPQTYRIYVRDLDGDNAHTDFDLSIIDNQLTTSTTMPTAIPITSTTLPSDQSRLWILQTHPLNWVTGSSIDIDLEEIIRIGSSLLINGDVLTSIDYDSESLFYSIEGDLPPGLEISGKNISGTVGSQGIGPSGKTYSFVWVADNGIERVKQPISVTVSWGTRPRFGQSFNPLLISEDVVQSTANYNTVVFPDQHYTVGQTISPLVLPSAVDGNFSAIYDLVGELPDGLTVQREGINYVVSGTPRSALPNNPRTLIWRAEDSDENTQEEDSDWVYINISVTEGDPTSGTVPTTQTTSPATTITPTTASTSVPENPTSSTAPITAPTTPPATNPTSPTTPTGGLGAQPTTPTTQPPAPTTPQTTPATVNESPSTTLGANSGITNQDRPIVNINITNNFFIFIDARDSVHRSSIAQLTETGIFQGCNPPDNTMFCPDRALTRAEMATLLVRALDLGSTNSNPFTDTSGSVHVNNINRVAAAGITRGCNPPDNTLFCPDREVTRAEMATFIVRALQLDTTGDTNFGDTTDNIHQTNIQAFANAGITRGCNPPDNTMYCPDRAVTRAEMATFLMRATNTNP